MASITIKKNGAQVNYNLAYLDYQKADAANTANAGSTNLGDLIYIQGNILASGTLQNAPAGADTDFYIFKCDSLPAGVLLSTPQGAVHESGNVMYLGPLNQSGTKYLDFFSPIADDVKPAINEVIDPFNITQKNFYVMDAGANSFLIGVTKAASSQPAIDAYKWNANGTAIFETENGGMFGAFCGAVPGSDSAHAALGVIRRFHRPRSISPRRPGSRPWRKRQGWCHARRQESGRCCGDPDRCGAGSCG